MKLLKKLLSVIIIYIGLNSKNKVPCIKMFINTDKETRLFELRILKLRFFSFLEHKSKITFLSKFRFC